jgi:hypothetical protein
MITYDTTHAYKTEEEYQQMIKDYENGTLKPTTKEGLIINPKVAYEVTTEDILKSIPFDKLSKAGITINRFSMMSPVDNLMWDYLHFVNVDVFRPAGLAFEKSMKEVKGTNTPPSYTNFLKGTKAYKDFWMEEGRRIIEGYEPIVDGKPCGLRISGEFYFYLNYGWIKKVEITENETIDRSGIPEFLAMDYYFFKELEARENPKRYGLPREFKQSMIVAKSRRKGFSYKAGAGAAWIAAFRNNAGVIIASATGEDAALCFDKAADVIDHLSRYTPFGREEIGLAKNNGGWKHYPLSRTTDSGYLELSLINTRTGERRGRGSFIQTVSLYNNNDGIAGHGLARVYIEEAGKITNLMPAWTITKESLRVGSVYRDGIAVVFGTGGEMVASSGKKGSSQDFSMLFNRPEANGFAAYRNIYEYRETENPCGYFVSDMWSNFGSYIVLDGVKYKGLDNKGNAFFWVAEAALDQERNSKKPPKDTKQNYEMFLTQRCKTPNEAFLITKGSRFQTEELIQRSITISSSKSGFEGLRIPGELVEINGVVEFIPKPDLQPITTTTVDITNREGCLLRYEAPIKIKGAIPDDAYIISVDPIGINTNSGKSLIGIIVYKTNKYSHYMGEEKIVATYWGRKQINPQDYMHSLLYKLSKYYNARITFENDRDGGIFQYFLKINALNRLMPTPVLSMNKFIPGAKSTLRQYGHSCSTIKHKELGENLIYEWLSKRGSRKNYFDDETGEKIVEEGSTNLDRLEDQLLIEQLINYDRDGNYDAVSTLMGIMFQLQELYTEEEEEISYNTSLELMQFYASIYGKQSTNHKSIFEYNDDNDEL